ncbi:MAG: hypothetical protein K9G41_02135 [Flavobacteriales bacterium]|nr:hypothetical protein [Flavobacteriales bacterium]
MNLIIGSVVALVALIIFIWIVRLRRIVPTNVVHIVQRGRKTVSYGVGQEAGNSYYEFPVWMPVIGVEKRVLPVSNFDITLEGYPAYDVDRVPFLVDIKAFFHIKDTNTASAKVENIEELKDQLKDIVRGVVRSILAKSSLEEIMGERPKYAKAFTEAVMEDLKSWGVESVKSIELMDVRDEGGSEVIHNIMAKKKSAIEKESRETVALNHQKAEQAELDARKEVEVRRAETEQASGEARARSAQAVSIAEAESAKKGGIAKQQAVQEVAAAEQLSAEEQMKVLKVQQIRQAEIDKERQIINAQLEQEQIEIKARANKYSVETSATAQLEARKREAEGEREVGNAEADVTLAKGKSLAESKKLDQLASVTAQTELAKEIGKNQEYQDYLVRQAEVQVSQIVGVAQYESIAKALENADLKLLVNSGDVQSGIGKLSDLFSSKGASQLNGLVEALKQTEEGTKILDSLKGIIPTGSKDS